MLLEVIALAIFVGWLAGGRPGRLAGVKLIGAELIFTALVMQLLAPRVSGANQTLGYLLLVLSYLVLLAALSRNEPSAAIALMAAGVFLNFVVISLNGGMPVMAAIPVGYNDGVHIGLSQATRMAWLGDVITWPFPGALGGLVSIGDILLAAGIGVFIFQGMKYKGRRSAF